MSLLIFRFWTPTVNTFFIKNGLNLFKEKPLNRRAVELQEIPINVYVMFYKALWD